MLVTASCKTKREASEKREGVWPILSWKPIPVGQQSNLSKFECYHLSLSSVRFFTRAQRYFVNSTQFLDAMLPPLGSLREPVTSWSPHVLSSAWNICLSSILLVTLLALQSLSPGTCACLPTPTELPVTGSHKALQNAYLTGNCEFSLGISCSVSSPKAVMYQGVPREQKHILNWYLCLPSPWDLFTFLFLQASVVHSCHEVLSICLWRTVHLCLFPPPFCHKGSIRNVNGTKLPKISTVI